MFFTKMDTLDFFLKIFMVYILIVVQDKLRQIYHVYVTGFFFVNSCTCSFLVNFIQIFFLNARSFAFFKGGLISIWSRRKQISVQMYKFLEEVFLLYNFICFKIKVNDKGIPIKCFSMIVFWLYFIDFWK